MRRGPAIATLVAACWCAGPSRAANPADPAAAEREYRIARRLAAEGSPQAAAALRRVFELDPSGPLADDALLDQALLAPVALWPGEIGRLDMVAAPGARGLVDRVLEEFPSADRALEARYLRALLRLEPVPGHDAASARADLIAVATSDGSGAWPTRARYALAWMLERAGQQDRSVEAYTRIVIDEPETPAAVRARVALGRLALGEERYGEAAVWLQTALDLGVPSGLTAAPLRECAMRRLLGAPGVTLEPIPTGAGQISGLAVTPSGSLVLSDRRAGRIQARDGTGSPVDEWSVEEPGAIIVDEAGRVHAVGGEAIYRLDPGGTRVHAASIGDYGPPTAVAAGRGGFWVLDRRGQRIGRIQPRAPAPLELWQGRGSKLTAMVWDGRRLIVYDSRSKSLIAITGAGVPRTLAIPRLDRPGQLAVDPSGRIALLDPRAGEVLLLDRSGNEVDRFPTAGAGLEKPAGIAFGMDGVLHLYDGESGAWVRRR